MAAAAFEEIVETFEFLDDWEDRYAHVIDLGRAMQPLDESLRTPATKVDGCASQVWLVPQVEGQVITFDGDSDAMIVRGLIAILRTLYSGRTAREILDIDAPAEFARLGLDSHLSAQRSNGLRAMIERVRLFAASAA
ncbi:SufE family protein [Pontivivens nitratireducens]|uniref:SufE family protein n=1 Tax=Pontivivens nitratireducens TaxID=2758038 RepID=A0A6G7VM15_9RHOB|nr:SufE family protein [Pontibrevibacter nitratireducens]QIK41061.1 SufE family protein [Pontibrevibacter nitratireducens]